MDTPDPTRGNAALWAQYIEQQWGTALTPFGGVLASGVIGFAIANLYAVAWGDVVGRLFTSNFADMPPVAHDADADVTLRPAMEVPPPHEPEPAPAWLRVAVEQAVVQIEARQREREELLLLVPV